MGVEEWRRLGNFNTFLARTKFSLWGIMTSVRYSGKFSVFSGQIKKK